MGWQRTLAGGLKAGGAMAASNVALMVVLAQAGFNSYPNDPSGTAMDLAGFILPVVVMGSLVPGAIGAFVWEQVHARWAHRDWQLFLCLALAVATLYTAWTSGWVIPQNPGVTGTGAEPLLAILHYWTALLLGGWLIPHFSETGCTCGWCPFCGPLDTD